MAESKKEAGSKDGPSQGPSEDEVLRRMLNTPPKPHRTKNDGFLRDGDFFLVRDGRFLIAHPVQNDEETGSTTADLYRNPADYRSGRAMERGFSFRL